jgi:hypothetical protein
MEKQGQFTLFTPEEFHEWLMARSQKRAIKIIQMHHTYKPGYKDFNGDNHFALLKGMHDYHVNVRKFTDIAQNLTTFPDGTVAVCRDFEVTPAGIKGHNTGAICIENLGNFDKGGDEMTPEQQECILSITRSMCERFELEPAVGTILYHCWFDVEGNKAPPAIPCKTCPGTNFFGGNTIQDFNDNFLPRIYTKV